MGIKGDIKMKKTNQLDIAILIEEYRKEVGELKNELIMQKVYAKQLEKEISNLKEQLKAEEETVVEYKDNK